MNLCSKPRCKRAGAAALAYDYQARRAVLVDPTRGEMSPHLYALCAPCAADLRPPRGWILEDQRTRPPLWLERLEPPERSFMSARAPIEEPEPDDERRAWQVFWGVRGDSETRRATPRSPESKETDEAGHLARRRELGYSA